MKKSFTLIGLIIALTYLGYNYSFARLTGTASDDIFCVGPSGAEICVDAYGNLIPTTNDDTDLGTSSLQWQDGYFDGTVYADVISNDGAYAGTTATFSGQVTLQSVSSTTIASLVPAAVGSIVYNSTRFAVCIGTATTAGSWIFQSTNPITTSGISCKE